MQKLIAPAIVVMLNLVALPVVDVVPAYAGQKHSCGSAQSTECLPPPNIIYHGTLQVTPSLKPTVCVVPTAYNLMTGPGVDFWFTYYLKYGNGRHEDMEPVIRTKCITEQWVVPGTVVGFWVDCTGERWWFESDPITTNGRYDMHFKKKQSI